jgi:hypothetical protein
MMMSTQKISTATSKSERKSIFRLVWTPLTIFYSGPMGHGSQQVPVLLSDELSVSSPHESCVEQEVVDKAIEALMNALLPKCLQRGAARLV